MQELDLTGLKCPLPVLHTQKALKALPIGDHLAVLTSDPMAALDLPHFCTENGHRLIEVQKQSDTTLRFVIEKTC